MNKKILKLSIISVLLISTYFPISAYAQNSNIKTTNEDWPRLQIESVIQKAKKYVQSQNINLENYYIVTITYNPDKKEWSIFFQGNYLVQGKMCRVKINDRTEEIKLDTLG